VAKAQKPAKIKPGIMAIITFFNKPALFGFCVKADIIFLLLFLTRMYADEKADLRRFKKGFSVVTINNAFNIYGWGAEINNVTNLVLAIAEIMV